MLTADPTKCTYTVEVRATDPDGMPEMATAVIDNSDVITVTITVTDVNEAPAVTGMDAITFAEDGDYNHTLGTCTRRPTRK